MGACRAGRNMQMFRYLFGRQSVLDEAGNPLFRGGKDGTQLQRNREIRTHILNPGDQEILLDSVQDRCYPETLKKRFLITYRLITS
jgi:hypothetical protein